MAGVETGATRLSATNELWHRRGVSALEVILAVAGSVVALLLFALEVHGRRMEHRSSRERIVIAAAAVLITALLAGVVFVTRRPPISDASHAIGDRKTATSTHSSPETAAALTTVPSSEAATSVPVNTVIQSPTTASEGSNSSENKPTPRPADEIILEVSGVSSLTGVVRVVKNGLFQESRNALISFLVTLYPTSVDDSAIVCDNTSLVDNDGRTWPLTESLYFVKARNRTNPPFTRFKQYPDSIRLTDVLRFTRPGRVPSSTLRVRLHMQCRLLQNNITRPFVLKSPSFTVSRTRDE